MGILGLIVAIAAVLIAVISTNLLKERLSRFETELALLRRQVRGDQPPPVPQPSPAHQPSPEIPAPLQAPPVAEIPVPLTQPTAPGPAGPQAKQRLEWEAMVGGKIFNRIGALALIVGVGFFLKYAFDNNLISVTVRVLLGGAAGLALLVVAEAARRKDLDIFAQGLVGAGLAILYLSDYAAFNFYHLIPQIAAFAIMVGITILAFQQAIRCDSLAISLLGWTGGFLTPFLIGSRNASETGLFGYFVLLDISLLAIVLRRRAWVVLELLTLLGTSVVYFYWWSQGGRDANFLPTVLFILLFWLLFHAADIQRASAHPGERDVLRHITASLNVLFLLGGMSLLFHRNCPEWQAVMTLGIGAAYFGSLVFLRSAFGDFARTRYLLAAVMFLAVATAVQYTNFTLCMLWCLEAAALAAIGLGRREFPVWTAALSLIGLALMAFLHTPAALEYRPIADFTLLFNLRAAALLSLTASCFVVALLFRRWPARGGDRVPDILHGAWFLLLFGLLTVEVLDVFRAMMNEHVATVSLERLKNLQQLSVSGVWLMYSVVVLALGIWRRRQWMRIAAITLFGVTIVKAFFFDLSFLETLYRIVSFIGLGIILVAVSYLYQRYRSLLFEPGAAGSSEVLPR